MKNLLVYFTYSGNTLQIVNTLKSLMDVDVFELQRKIPYSEDYSTCAYGDTKEEAEQKSYPEIQGPLPDIDEYDNIILVFPIWWYTFPRVFATFLHSYKNWKGKNIYILCQAFSNDPSYMDNAVRDAKDNVKNGQVIPGLFNKQLKRLNRWVKQNKL